MRGSHDCERGTPEACGTPADPMAGIQKRYDIFMCRSIKVLRRPEPSATPEEISAAALQFVRKVSGYHKPSKARQAVFDDAVREIAGVTDRLVKNLSSAPTAEPQHQHA